MLMDREYVDSTVPASVPHLVGPHAHQQVCHSSIRKYDNEENLLQIQLFGSRVIIFIT